MTGLRRAALVAVLAGQVGAWLAGVLPLLLLLPALLGTVGCARLATALPERTLRRVATGVALALCGLVLPQLSAASGAGGQRGVLGSLLVGISVVQALTWQRRRDLQTAVLTALGLLVLGASFAPDVLVGLPLLVGWGAAWSPACSPPVSGPPRPRTSSLLAVHRARPSSPLRHSPGCSAWCLPARPHAAGRRSGQRLGSQQAVGSGRAAPGAYSGQRVDLRVRGELSDRPLIEVPDDSPALWRSGVYDTWDGGGWTITGPRRQVPVAVGTSTARSAPTGSGSSGAPTASSAHPARSPGRPRRPRPGGRVRRGPRPHRPEYAVTSVVLPHAPELRAAPGRT